jgi:hypothetical protein
MAKRKPVPGADSLPRTFLVQVTVPFADGMLLEKLTVKRRGEGAKASQASKGALVAEAIRQLAAREGIGA